MSVHHLYIPLLALSLAWCPGCSRQEASPEAQGQRYLWQARKALAHGTLQEAKALIDSLRQRTPLALNSREEGILLLDSVCIQEAQDELFACREAMRRTDLDRVAFDSFDFQRDALEQKVRFYERKLNLDKSKRRKH